jgi:hypothetical protein
MFRAETGLDAAAADAAIREHIGVCLDACHLAVEFEDPAEVLAALDRAGIRVPKTQLSAGLRVLLPGTEQGDAAALGALATFADDVYLHQVVERRADGSLRRHLDLPQALAADPGRSEPREWRIHFHVPLFRDRYGELEGTQRYVGELLGLVRERTDCTHFEVETYTWDVLPEEYRRDDIVIAVSRELEWAAGQLAPPAASIAPR